MGVRSTMACWAWAFLSDLTSSRLLPYVLERTLVLGSSRRTHLMELYLVEEDLFHVAGEAIPRSIGIEP